MGALFVGLYKLFKILLTPKKVENGGVANSVAEPQDFDKYVAKVLLDIKDGIDKLQPLLDFSKIFDGAREVESTGKVSDFQVLMNEEKHNTEAVWKIFANLDQKIGSVIWVMDTSEPKNIQLKRKELGRLDNFANSFKNLLVTRGQIVRQFRDLYDGRKRREETKKREEEKLETLVKIFNKDKERILAQAELLKSVVENLQKI